MCKRITAKSAHLMDNVNVTLHNIKRVVDIVHKKGYKGVLSVLSKNTMVVHRL
jgi:hypothetical protein